MYTYDELMRELKRTTIDGLIEIHNEIVERANYFSRLDAGAVFKMDDFNDVMAEECYPTYDVVRACINGNFNPGDAYFWGADGGNTIVSFTTENDDNCPLEPDEMAIYIANSSDPYFHEIVSAIIVDNQKDAE